MQPLRRNTSLCRFILYFTLGHVVGGKTCGGDTLLRVTDTRWQKGLCSIQSKVESIVLKAAWPWGRDSSVTNITLGVRGCTPLFVFIPSVWGFVDVDVFFPLLWGRAP